MTNDCVYEAWADYARHLGIKVNLSDRLAFYGLRFLWDWTLPGKRTSRQFLLPLLGDMCARKRMTITEIQTDVYSPNEFGLHLMKERVEVLVNNIDLTQGLFFSLNTKHAYFSPLYRGGDWICLAVSITRRIG